MSKLSQVVEWRNFDEWFTAPMLGLPNAESFYALASANNFLPNLQRPFLAVNAANDPIITEACLPKPAIRALPHFRFEFTREGGHVGYRIKGRRKHNWMDIRAWAQAQDWIA